MGTALGLIVGLGSLANGCGGTSTALSDAGAPDGASDATACGAVAQACCNGTACNAGLSCISGACAIVCGADGQPCCNGTACNNGLMCSAGTCVAVAASEAGAEGGVEAGTDSGSTGGPDAACGDTLTDTHNCGRCGHDCCGGLCQGGVCQPLTLVSAQYGTGPIVLDKTNAYWLGANGSVQKCALAGCSTPTQLVTSQPMPFQIAVDATSVYWTNSGTPGQFLGSVEGCAIGGCADTPQAYVNSLTSAGWLVVDSTNLYFSAGDSALYECAIGGCGGKPTQLAAQTYATGIAVDSTTVYWGSNPTNPGSVVACPITGCNGTPTTLAVGQVVPNSLALDAANVYWTTYGDGTGATGTVAKCAKGGCNGSPTVLASNQVTPMGITLDARYLYWIDGTFSSTVMAAPIAGGPAFPVLPVSLSDVVGIALSSSCIYFSGGLGAVNVIAKP